MLPKFADMEWQPRWNRAEQEAMVSQSGSQVLLLTMMGTVRFELTDSESIASYCRQMRSAVDLLEKTKAQYDSAMQELFTRGRER